jgi:hypothetical protein
MSKNLNHSPAEIIAAHLIVENLGTHPKEREEWPIYNGTLPAVQVGVEANAICVRNTAGRIQNKSHKTKITHRSNGLSIEVRAELSSEGWVKANNILDALGEVLREDIILPEDDVYLIHSCTATTPVVNLGKSNDDKLHRFTVNLLTTISPE